MSPSATSPISSCWNVLPVKQLTGLASDFHYRHQSWHIVEIKEGYYWIKSISSCLKECHNHMSDKSSLSLLSVNTDGAGNSMHLLCIDGLPQNFVNTKQYTCQQLSLDPSRLKQGKKLMERVQWFERASFNKIVPMYSRTWIINLNNLPKCVKKSSAHQQNLTGLDFCEANLSN